MERPAPLAVWRIAGLTVLGAAGLLAARTAPEARTALVGSGPAESSPLVATHALSAVPQPRPTPLHLDPTLPHHPAASFATSEVRHFPRARAPPQAGVASAWAIPSTTLALVVGGLCAAAATMLRWCRVSRRWGPQDVDLLEPFIMTTATAIRSATVVTPEEALALWREGYSILDIRSDAERWEGRIRGPDKGAVELPLIHATPAFDSSIGRKLLRQRPNEDWLQQVRARFGPEDRLIVMCSDGGQRTAQALALLQVEGYHHASGMLGGFNKWDQLFTYRQEPRSESARRARASGLRDPTAWLPWAPADSAHHPHHPQPSFPASHITAPAAAPALFAASAVFASATLAPPMPTPAAPASPLPPVTPGAHPEQHRIEKRAVYTAASWRRHRSGWRFSRHLATLGDSIVLQRALFPSSMAVAVVTALVCLAELNFPDAMFGLPTAAFALSAPFVGLLLVFRTNASYERWDGGRKLVGLAKNRSEDLTRQMCTWFPAERPELQEQFLRHLQAFFFALKVHLRGDPDGFEDDTDLVRDLRPVLTPPELDLMLRSTNRPAHALYCLTRITHEARLDGAALYCLDQNLTNLADVLGGCERILRTPIPLSYTRHTGRFLFTWLLLLPLALCGEVLRSGGDIWLTVPTMLFMSFVLLGIEEVAVQIEEPFSILPLEAYAEGSRKNTQGIFDLMAQTANRPPYQG